MKSVCFVLQGVYDTDPRVRRKAEALVAAGYSVDVLALRSSNGKEVYSLNGVNVRTISLGKKRGTLARYGFEYGIFFVWVLARLPVQTWRRRYRIIDVNTLPDFLVFAAALAKWMGAKLILDMHEITPEFYISKYGVTEHSWMIRALKYMERKSFGFADHVITINHAVEDLLVHRGLPRLKSTIIMNSVDESQFAFNSISSVPQSARARAKFVMVYHGTLTRIYGLDIAIEAFALVHMQMPGAELWILGSGPEKDTLTKLVQERKLASKVRMVGRVAPDEIPSWLAQCDVGILPIRQDVFLDFAFPNKLPELIVMGKTVLISGLKVIRHYFSEQALAYFQPNNATDMAKQMLRLYRDPQFRDHLALKAREEYMPIRWDVMRTRYVTTVEQLLGIRGHVKVRTEAVIGANSG